MLQTDTGWRLDVERGPDWVFVRLYPPLESAPDFSTLGEEIWSLLEQSFTYRLVLELDEVCVLQSYLLTQLVMLSKRVQAHGGTLRLCGISPDNRSVIHVCRLDDYLPSYESRTDAVRGNRPLPAR